MENLKRLLAILTVVAMLFVAGGVAEEQADAGAEPAPAEESGEAPAEEAPAATLALNANAAVINYSQSVTLTATASAGGDSVAWTSSDEGVARLSANRGESVTVTALSEGTATITCTSGELTQTCTMTVVAPDTLQITGVDYPSTYRMAERGWKVRGGVLASNVDLATVTTVLKSEGGETIGEPYTYTFQGGVRRYEIGGLDNYVPFSRVAAEGTYAWTLSATDASGRMVSLSLPIHAVADGETEISSDEGAYSPFIVASRIMLDSEEIAMLNGGVKKLTAKVFPNNAMNRSLVWVSGDPTVATVSPEGEVTGVGVGATTVTCRTLGNPNVFASCPVTVLGVPSADASQLLYGTNSVNALTDDGSWAGMHWRAASGGTGVRESIAVSDAPVPGIQLGWKLAWEEGAVDIAQDGVPIQPGETYTLSCYARGSGKLRLQVGQGPEYPGTEHEVNGSNWQRYQMAYTFGGADEGSGSGATNAYFGCSGGEIEICGMKFERGGAAGEWTPAAGEAGSQREGLQLLRGTNATSALADDGLWTRAHWRVASGGTGAREPIAVADAPIVGIGTGWKLTWEDGAVDIAQDYVPIQAGGTYTLSCYARGTGTLRLQVGMGPEYPSTTCEVDSAKWQRFEMTYTFGGADEGSGSGMTSAYFGCSSGSVEVCGMKLELGGADTGWSPAPGEGN